MTWITDKSALEALYGAPAEASIAKVAKLVTPEYRSWIMASRLCLLSSVGAEGTDGSPRGDDGPVVQIPAPDTILMPDWRGNNRIDSLRNIVEDGRVSLMFLVRGSDTVVRVNGTARLSVDPEIIGRFTAQKRLPRSVIVVQVGEVYFQCARALMRGETWGGDSDAEGLPSLGKILAVQTGGGFDGASYDRDWAERAAKTMWNAD